MPGRMVDLQDALATLGSAPWRRAPLLLWRRPGVLAAVAGAFLVLTASLAAVPLFLSSVGTAALSKQIEQRCPWTAGATIAQGPFIGVEGEHLSEALDTAGRAQTAVTRRVEGIGAPVVTYRVPSALSLGPPGPVTGSARVQLMTRDGALDHVTVLAASPDAGGPALWISATTAEMSGLGAGDEAVLSSSADGVPVFIAGVYEDIAGPPLDDYWCSQSQALREDARGDLPAPLILVDQATFLSLFDVLGASFSFSWEVPVDVDRVTLPEASKLSDTFATWDQRIGEALAASTSPGAHVFPPASVRTNLDFLTGRSEAIVTSVGGGAVPVAAAAAVAGAVMIAAAASLWFDRRRQEVELLAVRGVSPAGIGLKAVLELLVPAIVGSAAGYLLALALVARLGPSSRLDGGALAEARVVTIAAGVGAGVVLALVVSVRARYRVGQPRRRRLRLGLVPWELVLAGLAWVSLRRLDQWGVPLAAGDEVSRVDQLGLAFPLFFLATGVAVIARVLLVALRPIKVRSQHWPTVLFFAVRRVDAFRVAAVALVAASAAAAGVLAYAGTLTSSLNATLDAKVKTFVGSDVAVQLLGDQEPPRAIADQTTKVVIFPRATVGDTDVIVYGVDPDTFARGAFWDAGFSSSSLGTLLDRLHGGDGGRVPAIVVGGPLPAGESLTIDSRDEVSFSFEGVGEAEVFPTLSGSRRAVVVPAAALEHPRLAPAIELWIEGDPGEIFAALDAAGTAIRFRRDASQVIDQTSFLTVAWTFGFLKSLGVAAAVTTVGGMAIYLDARRRARVLAYAFARRMGLPRVSHRRTLVTELTATVSVGCWLGLVLAVMAAWLAYGRLDPVPQVPPGSLLRPAVTLIVGLAVAGGLLAWLGARVAQRRADRDDPVEVLRAGV